LDSGGTKDGDQLIYLDYDAMGILIINNTRAPTFAQPQVSLFIGDRKD
jgi:hypothetical protein